MKQKKYKFAKKYIFFYEKIKKNVFFLAYGQYTSMFFFKKKNLFVSKKYITLEFWRKMYFSIDFIKKKIISRIFGFLQHVCKIQRVLANIPKILKTFFGDSYYSLLVFG